MKALYFDLIGGISGDMIVGAFLDLGVNFQKLKQELKKIKGSGYVLKKRRVGRGHLRATKFDVVVQQKKNYSYRQIIHCVRASRLLPSIKNNILKVYKTLADAEIKVHGHQHKDIHFEQLGDIDSLVDIAAACLCLDKIKATELYYSVIPLNKNMAAAIPELLINKKMYFTNLIYENVTPTGMAFLCTLGKQLNPFLKNIFTIGRCGYGAGALDPPQVTNVLRVLELKSAPLSLQTDQILVLQANIDDMNPQFFDYLFDKLFEAGALDVFVENVLMKKTRPGFLLTVLLKDQNLGMITHLLLSETTTLGVRFYPVDRLKLNRMIEYIGDKGRKMGVKVAPLPGGGFKVIPEYEHCKSLAQKTKIPIHKIYQDIQQKAERIWRFRD